MKCDFCYWYQKGKCTASGNQLDDCLIIKKFIQGSEKEKGDIHD